MKSSVCIAILKPSPSSPRRFAAGTTTSVSANAEVSVERWPILSRCFSTETPGASIGTMKADRPRWPLLGSVLAKTTVQAAWPAFEMNVFEPLRTYSSPRRSAVDLIRATSEPASGSVRPKEQRIGSSSSGGSHSRFCSSVPASRTGPAPSVFAVSDTAIPAQPQESSSPIRIPSKVERPRPPYSSGTWTFIRPSSCALAITSAGWVWCSSYSAALGRISFSANSRASARSSFCSSVSANETPVAVVSIVATALSLLVD